MSWHLSRRNMLLALLGLLGLGCLGNQDCSAHLLALLPYQTNQPVPDPPRPVYDPYLRLLSHPDKQEIPCPQQTPRTKVLLLIGQSNAGNHAEQDFQTQYGEKVVNWSGNHCYLAASPLLGSTGRGGESWTLLGNLLVESGLADQVLLVPAAVSGTGIARWQAGGNLNRMLLNLLAGLRPRYRITQVLWHQGEADANLKTSQADYRKMFLSLAQSLRQAGVKAPIFVSVASICGQDPAWHPDNPVVVAQQSLPDPLRQIYAGVNTDQLLLPQDRMDGCHFSRTGQEKFARAWLERLRADPG